MSLKHTGMGGVMQQSAAIDEALRHVADFGDMKMRWNRAAIWKDKARLSDGVGGETGFQFAQFHAVSIFLYGNIVKNPLALHFMPQASCAMDLSSPILQT
jgi:hypothetical protein